MTTYFILACWTLEGVIARRDALLSQHSTRLTMEDSAAMQSSVFSVLPASCSPCPPLSPSAPSPLKPAQRSTGTTAAPTGSVPQPTVALDNSPDAQALIRQTDQGPFFAVSDFGFSTINDANTWLQSNDGQYFAAGASNTAVLAINT